MPFSFFFFHYLYGFGFSDQLSYLKLKKVIKFKESLLNEKKRFFKLRNVRVMQSKYYDSYESYYNNYFCRLFIKKKNRFNKRYGRRLLRKNPILFYIMRGYFLRGFALHSNIKSKRFRR